MSQLTTIMANRLFGTDGIRGVAGAYPLDDLTIARIGAAAVRVLRSRADHEAIGLVVGRDTRESGPSIEAALARGVRAEGASIVSAGVMPTPAIAFLAGSMAFDGGFVISASHNPYRDNGIKVFSRVGEKLDDELEAAIERVVLDDGWSVPPFSDDPVPSRDFTNEYVTHVTRMLPAPERLRSLRMALDCANGAVSHVAPAVFGRLGIDVRVFHDAPDGRNINRECGSTVPDQLARVVRDGAFDVGIAFDGDGDRAILVDEHGEVIDGDGILMACAVHLKAHGRLSGNAVVATIMSNIGLEVALRKHEIALVRCPVGDRAVTEAMKRHGLSLGGEQSGHVVLADHLTTGDGIATSLAVLDAMADRGCGLAALVEDLQVFPQVLVNVPVKDKAPLENIAPIRQTLLSVERALGDQGRLVVRYSGTEPLLRVMIEGADDGQIRAWADEIVQAVRTHLA